MINSHLRKNSKWNLLGVRGEGDAHFPQLCRGMGRILRTPASSWPVGVPLLQFAADHCFWVSHSSCVGSSKRPLTTSSNPEAQLISSSVSGCGWPLARRHSVRQGHSWGHQELYVLLISHTLLWTWYSVQIHRTKKLCTKRIEMMTKKKWFFLYTVFAKYLSNICIKWPTKRVTV